MKDVLFRVISNPSVRKAFLALVLAVLTALGIGFGGGCGGAALHPAAAKAQAVLECQLAAVERVVPREVAADLIRAGRDRDRESLTKQLLGLGLQLKPSAVRQAVDAFVECASPPAPEGDADAPDAS
jgi:hypothetical protein